MSEHRKTFGISPRPVIRWGQGFPHIEYQSYTADLGDYTGFVDYEPYNVPGYKTYIRKGTNATSHMYGEVTKFQDNNVQFKTRFTQPQLDGTLSEWILEIVGSNAVYFEAAPAPPTTQYKSEADNLAAEKLQKRIFEVQRQFQTGVFLGELAETIQLITNPVRGLFELTTEFLSRVKKRAKKPQKRKKMKDMISEEWLKYSFGVLPLISDIEGAADAAAHIITYRMPRETVNGSGIAGADPVFRSVESPMGPWSMITDIEKHFNTEVKYKACVLCSNDTTRNDLDSLGISWGNFAPTLWEIIPFSFLIDYFTNCGKVIDSLAINHSRVGWVCRSEKSMSYQVATSKSKDNIQLPPASFDGGWLQQQPGKQAIFERYTFDRDSYGGLPTPQLRFRLPFDKPIKNANLVALAVLNRDALNTIKANLR